MSSAGGDDSEQALTAAAVVGSSDKPTTQRGSDGAGGSSSPKKLKKKKHKSPHKDKSERSGDATPKVKAEGSNGSSRDKAGSGGGADGDRQRLKLKVKPKVKTEATTGSGSGAAGAGAGAGAGAAGTSSGAGGGQEGEQVKYYEKPGQRHVQPSPGAGDRVFYESMYKQCPNNDMALIWCIEHGVLPMDDAKSVYQEYLNAKQRATELNRSRVRRAAALSPTASGSSKKSKKPRIVAPAAVSAADIGMSLGTGQEGMGTMGM